MKTSYKKQSEEVYYSDELIVKVNKDDISELVKLAGTTARKRVRLCSHSDEEDLLHEMFIIHEKKTYVPPHKHLNKVESFHIVHGVADIIVFNEDGQITDIIPMGDYHSGLSFYYRLPPALFHTLLIYSENLVFHEITNGPFRQGDILLAAWAPSQENPEQIEHFMRSLENQVNHLKKIK